MLEQKLPVGGVQPGNERGVAGVAHDVLAGAGELAEHPRGVHERGGFSEADERGGPAGERAKLLIDDTAGLSILQLRARARRMQQQHGIKLFVIDYLQLAAFYCAASAGKPAAGNRRHFQRHQGAGEGIEGAGACVEPVEPRTGKRQKPQAAVERLARIRLD